MEDQDHLCCTTNCEDAMSSCWGRLMVSIRKCWRRSRIMGSSSSSKARAGAGSFRYDPLSYARNFDEGCWEDAVEHKSGGFNARYALPISKKKQLDGR